MFNDLRNRKQRSKWHVDLALHQAFESATDYGHILRRVVLHIQQHTVMLRPLPVGGAAAWLQATAIVDGLLSLASHHRAWLRDAQTWQPAEGSLWSQFGSLSQHLFARKPIPHFMTSVWFEGRSAQARRHQHWFRHLGLGYGIRGVVAPISLTKLMGRFFLEAPEHCSVHQALRWSQVRGLGGDSEMANAIITTRLGTTFDHDRYWSLVIRFLIDNPELGAHHVASIVDYLHVNRRLFRHLASRRLRRKQGEDFLRQVRRWQGQPTVQHCSAPTKWNKSGLDGFEYDEELRAWNPCRWTIRELLDSNQLLEEGRAMRHCVGRYGWKCAKGISSIWSLARSDGREQNRRELTIELNPRTKTVVQAKGPRNSFPTPRARKIMLLWAREQGLSVKD